MSQVSNEKNRFDTLLAQALSQKDALKEKIDEINEEVAQLLKELRPYREALDATLEDLDELREEICDEWWAHSDLPYMRREVQSGDRLKSSGLSLFATTHTDSSLILNATTTRPGRTIYLGRLTI